MHPGQSIAPVVRKPNAMMVSAGLAHGALGNSARRANTAATLPPMLCPTTNYRPGPRAAAPSAMAARE